MRFLLALTVMLVPLGALAEGLPKAVQSKIKRDAAGYLADLTVLIEGFGQNGAIDAKGLRNVVLLARAEARALALRRLQGADLDGDGTISGEEVAIAAAAASAVARGRLKANFAAADGNSDGRVTMEELQAHANGVALEAFSPAKEAAMLAVLGFDGDGDGRVTLAEVRAAVAALASSPGQAKEIQNEFQIEADDHQGNQPGDNPQPHRRDQSAHLGAI